MQRLLPLVLGSLLSGAACATAASAQGFTPPRFNYSYGYQPYNDSNPTGFNHPNNMGYGHYVYDPKLTGHRTRALHYRRFKGY